MKLREIPGRVTAGSYVLHSGYSKWNAGPEQAQGIHAMASGAYPFLKNVPPQVFVKALSAGEMATGVMLLAPFIPTALAGAALTGLGGGLVGLYARTPALREPGSIWPSQAGVAISKDIWLLGIGAGLLIDACQRRRQRKRQ